MPVFNHIDIEQRYLLKCYWQKKWHLVSPVSGFPNGLSSPNAMEFKRELSCKECKVSPRAALQGSGVQVPRLKMSQNQLLRFGILPREKMLSSKHR